MLVLTRKPQEKIRIGDSITITVIKTKGQGVRLGIEAPADVPVLRGELIAAHDSFASSADGNAQPCEPVTGARKRKPADQQGTVSFARVDRSRVATVLPDVLGDAGPLRSMLDSRQSASA